MQPPGLSLRENVQLAPIVSPVAAGAGSMISAPGVGPLPSHQPVATLGPKWVDGKYQPALRVLVVEDDALIGALLGQMLEEMGHEVCAVESTEADAVTAAARWNPDLIIVDVRLGDGSGVAAIDEIYRIRPVAHVFVSGDISSIKALRPGAAMIEKPYREADLALVIRRALDVRSVS